MLNHQQVQPATEDAHKQSHNIADLHAQLLLCPDGSDPMRNGSGLVNCGAGMELDGQPLCQPGFYCSIDAERNGKQKHTGIKCPIPNIFSSFLLSIASAGR